MNAGSVFRALRRCAPGCVFLALVGGCDACVAVSAEGEVVSEGEGEGEGDGDAGEGEGDGDGGARGDVCAGDDDCSEGFVCGSFFQNPQLPKGCLPTCADTRGQCDADGDGDDDDDCGEFPSMSAPVCVRAAGLLEPCGNGAAAVCAIEAFCAVSAVDDPATAFDDTLVGRCVIPCSAEGLCDFGLACSDDVRVNGAGVCVDETAAFDPCGDGDDGALVVCTGDQTCDGATCQPDDGDGDGEGEGEGAGEGEGEGEP